MPDDPVAGSSAGSTATKSISNADGPVDNATTNKPSNDLANSSIAAREPRPIVPSKIRPSVSLSLSHRSPIIPFLKRLTFILSLVLGSAAIGSWIWSTFLLPLLHSSFSARKALADQQKERMDSLLQSLKAIRSRRIYATSQADSKDIPISQGHHETTDGKLEAATSEEARLHPVEDSETTSQASSSRLPLTSDRLPLIPLHDLSSLSSNLKDLSSALDSTSTTRTSLLSTLEMYTSQIQRDVFLRSSRGNPSNGLSTLSQNLDRERGYASSAEEGRSEEWREARKEIRAMKGILLGRRNFAPATVNG